MNEAVMAVLMYLFENHMQSCCEIGSEKLPVVNELREAGFEQDDIYCALDWLNHLAESEESLDHDTLRNSTSMRVFTDSEYKLFGSLCCGFIIYLQCLKILNPITRELVIDCLHSMGGEICMADVKWAVLMILFHRPDEKQALKMMEDLVLQEGSEEMH